MSQNQDTSIMTVDAHSQLAETASAAASSTAIAAVQARYVMAERRPRNLHDVRINMLKECKRTRFAETARYLKPIGDGITGPSIRFAEMAIRCMTNIFTETSAVYDDKEKRILRVTVMDLESNATYSKDVTVSKTVERKKKPKGKVIGTRINSYGDMIYIIPATDDDILNKENALVSKAVRTCVLRLIPGDIMDECMEAVVETLKSSVKQDPKVEQKRIADAFSELNVNPSDLESFLGCQLGQASDEQIIELKAMYRALQDGEITVGDILDSAGNPKKSESKGKDKALGEILKKRVAAMKKNSKEAQEKPADDSGESGDDGYPPPIDDGSYPDDGYGGMGSSY